MSLENTNKRLLEELKTTAGLLKMKIRVEGSQSKDYCKLTASIDSILALESQALGQIKYLNDLEAEVKELRATCEKFSELSGSVTLIHNKYKQQISQLSSEKAKLTEEILNIRLRINISLTKKPEN